MKQRLSKEEGDVLAENGIEIKIIGKIRTAYPNIGELIEWVIRESGMGYQHDYNPMTKQHSLLLYNESSEFFFNDVKAEELIDALFEMVIKIKESNEVSK